MEKQHLKYIYLCTLVAALGGLLFGYDTAVVAGAIGFIKLKYVLSPAMTGWVASCALIGCMAGAMFAGILSDQLGRKKVLFISGIAFAISSFGIILDLNLNWFILFRFIGGLGIGIASILAPLYISEIAPSKIRGRLISIYQLGIVIGILLIYFVNAKIAGLHTEIWNISVGWRYMFGSGIIPALIFISFLFFVPESPRWLVFKNRLLEAEQVFINITGLESSKQELENVKSSLINKEESFSTLFKPGLRKALIIGILLSIFSQITGINVIMYYAPLIFKVAGGESTSALMQTVLIGCINLIMTFVSIKYVDNLGRRTLLLIGSLGMSICLAIVGFAFYNNINTSYLILTGILFYISFFAISLGPLTFVVVAEIFPTSIRGSAMSVAIFFLWLSVFVVSQTFPMLLESIGIAYTFWIYMLFSVIAFCFVFKFIPETKGKSLEEIQNLWSSSK